MAFLRVMVLSKSFYTMAALRFSFSLTVALDIVFCRKPAEPRVFRRGKPAEAGVIVLAHNGR
jgi:hypothetical protein